VSDKFKLSIRQSVSDEFKTGEKIGIPPIKIISKVSFSHLVEHIKIHDNLKPAFYELECTKGVWSVRELKRQIQSLYFERSGISKDKAKLSEYVNDKSIQLQPNHIINSPFSIEFLGLSDRAIVTESDLEQALIENLQHFLLEMGNGFCFEARQKRILIDDEYYFIDLVFYNRLLKCLVIVELKTEKFTHNHASQLNFYLNYFRHEIMQKDDNPPVGILLCTEKGETTVQYATSGLSEQIFVQKYKLNLPSEKELMDYINTY
jgi:predicted nuclease of restriction endonuclease-like (RecB) superfamily